MKLNINRCILLLVLSACLQTVDAQFIPENDKSLYEIMESKESYFDSLKQITPDSIFYSEGGDYNQYRKFLKFWEPRLYPHGDFQQFETNLRSTIETLDSTYSNFRTPSAGSNGDWFEVGPVAKPANGIYCPSNGTLGIGPIEFIQFFEGDADKMLCGSEYGGIFYSEDAGVTWTSGGSDVQWNLSGCNWALFHPSNSNIWYATSVHGQFHWYSGLYKTSDAGSTWTKIADHSNIGAGFHYEIFRKMVLDFDQPDNVLFVPMSHGLFRSGNIGSTNPTFPRLTDPLVAYNDVYDLEMKLNDHNTLFATIYDYSINQWKLAVTTNSGTTWSQLPNVPSVINSVTRFGQITCELTSANNDYVYFLFDNNSISAKVWRFDYANSTWTDLSNPTGLKVTHGFGHGFGVSPFVTDEFYVSDEIFYRPRIGGNWLSNNNPGCTYHADIEDIVYHPDNPGEVWMATHGGISKSVNNNQIWSDMSEGLGVAQVISLATSATDPGYMLIGSFHDGSNRSDPPHIDGVKPEWRTIMNGDGDIALIDHKDPKYMFASNQKQMKRSTMFGIENSFIASGLNGQFLKWEVTGVLNAYDPSIVYTGGYAGALTTHKYEVYRSTDRGHHRSPISDFEQFNFLNGEYITSKLWSSIADPHFLYVNVKHIGSFTDPPYVHKLFRTKYANSTNPAPTFEFLATPRDWEISSIVIDEEDPNIIYLTYSSGWIPAGGGGVVYKIDYTNSNISPTVTDLSKNLPHVGLGYTSLVREMGTDGAMYLATDVGVFYTNNKLLEDPDPTLGWTLMGSNLPHCKINGIEINYVINKVRVGTYGRGVWENDLVCPPDISLVETGSYVDDKFIEAQQDITSDAVIGSNLDVKYRAGLEVELVPGFESEYGGEFEIILHACNSPGNNFRLLHNNLSESELSTNTATSEVEEIIAFPNPCISDLTVKFSGKLECTNYRVILRNLLGTAIKQIENGNSINMSGIEPGVYIIEVQCNEQRFSERIIKL